MHSQSILATRWRMILWYSAYTMSGMDRYIENGVPILVHSSDYQIGNCGRPLILSEAEGYWNLDFIRKSQDWKLKGIYSFLEHIYEVEMTRCRGRM